MAQSNLGFMYSNGEGVLTDTKRAYMWYNLASYNGNEIAGIALSIGGNKPFNI